MKFMHRFMAMTLISLMAAAHAEQAVVATDAVPARPAHPMYRGEHAGGHDLMDDLARTKAELKLTAAQEAQWQDAEAASRSVHQAMKQHHEQIRAVMDAEKQKEVMDLAKLDQTMSAQREQGRQAHEAAHAKWLAVYQGLDTDQKRIVSQHLKDKLARMDQMREHFRAHGHKPSPSEPGKG